MSSTMSIDEIQVVQYALKYSDEYFGIAKVPETPLYLLHCSCGNTANKQKFSASFDPCNFKNVPMEGAIGLRSDSGAHNLCLLNECDQLVAREEARSYLPCVREASFMGIGGQFYGRDHPRFHPERESKYSGIHLYQILCEQNKVTCTRVVKLVDGHHPGCIDRREKVNNVAEFDGQSCVIRFGNQWHLYTRANCHAEGGFRAVQVAKGATMNKLDAFTPVVVATVPPHSNIYFGHMYVAPGGTAILAVMPIAWGAPDEHHSGIYVSISRDGIVFDKPLLLYGTESYEGRTSSLPCHGLEFTAKGFKLMIYKNIRRRMSEEQIRRARGKPQLFRCECIVPEGFGRCWGVLALLPAPPKPFPSIERERILLGMVEVCVAANAPELRNPRWSAKGLALGCSCYWPEDFLWQICSFSDGEEWVPMVNLILAYEPWQWRSKEGYHDELKGYAKRMISLFVRSYNAAPGAFGDMIDVCTYVTDAAKEAGIKLAVAPTYKLRDHRFLSHMKYGFTKSDVHERYRVVTKAQAISHQTDPYAQRARDAARGILPQTFHKKRKTRP